MKQNIKEIFFRKTGKVSGMCEDYIEIIYKDKKEDNLYSIDKPYSISLYDDVIRIFWKWISIWIDVSKKDKNRFRLFFTFDKL